MEEAIAGFYRSQSEGHAALKALETNGFTQNEVSFVTGDTRPHQQPAVGPVQEIGAETEASTDAWIGGAVGLAAGAIAVVLPGIGPLLMLGPLAGAIGGMSVGAAAGGIIGLLKDNGVSEDEAKFYAEGVKQGGALVTVHDVSEERAKKARKILDDMGAIEVEKLTEDSAR